MRTGASHQEFYDNGYGISVICHDHSYGLELAVLVGTEESSRICYDTPIASDVLGHLSVKQLYDIVEEIKALPVRNEDDKYIAEQLRAQPYIDDEMGIFHPQYEESVEAIDGK